MVKRIVINPEPLMTIGLIKDLIENEDICPTCHGLGMVIINNIYGI